MGGITIYLGNKRYSSWSLRAWLALAQTGAAFEEVVIPLDRPDSKAALRRHSPSGRVPALRHGDLLLWESLAICEYLAESFPAARLLPADRAARAVARAVASEMHAGFAELRRVLPMDLGREAPAPERRAMVEPDIARIAAIWRDCRARFGKAGANGAGPFLFGGFTIADAMFAPVATRFRSYGVALEPEEAAYAEALLAMPAMRRWYEAAAAEPWRIDYPPP